MFRSGTTREIECVLRGGPDGCRLPPRPHGPNREAVEKAYKKILSDRVRESMLAAASKLIVTELQQQKRLQKEVSSATGLEFECQCLDAKSNCEKCQSICTNFAEGILSVLERDFMQLLHGERSHLVADREGVRFLLTGVILALLYESVPEKTGLDELVLTALVVMIDAERWTDALELYGAAPKREVVVNKTGRSFTIGASQVSRTAHACLWRLICTTQTMRQAARSARMKKKGKRRNPNGPAEDEEVDPDHCPECGEVSSCGCGCFKDLC